MKIIIAIVLGLGFILISRHTLTSNAATFERLAECHNSGQNLPIEICAVEEWSKLDQDINEAYRAARTLYAESPEALRALTQAHRDFNSVRMYRELPSVEQTIAMAEGIQRDMEDGGPRLHLAHVGFAADILIDANEPERHMRRHLKFLRGLAAPRDGIEGRWISPTGEIIVSNGLFGQSARARVYDLRTQEKVCEARSVAIITESGFSLDGTQETHAALEMRGDRRGALRPDHDAKQRNSAASICPPANSPAPARHNATDRPSARRR
jgi:hypothetical protein